MRCPKCGSKPLEVFHNDHGQHGYFCVNPKCFEIYTNNQQERIEKLEAELERLKISYNDDMNRWSSCLDRLETALEKIDHLSALLKRLKEELTLSQNMEETLTKMNAKLAEALHSLGYAYNVGGELVKEE